mmetsp:Transcript_17590/g.44747  ORF Transcript_17590/g.44747 Transcript_17590/m.44747 type:complete len:104 (+) Transcript_17590:3-314(+)
MRLEPRPPPRSLFFFFFVAHQVKLWGFAFGAPATTSKPGPMPAKPPAPRVSPTKPPARLPWFPAGQKAEEKSAEELEEEYGVMLEEVWKILEGELMGSEKGLR